MATQDPIEKKEQLWLLFFIVTPCSLLLPMAGALTDDSSTELLVSGALGLFGAAVGLGLHALFGKRSVAVRIATLFLVLLVGIGLAVWTRP
jgi:hypothetical protein